MPDVRDSGSAATRRRHMTRRGEKISAPDRRNHPPPSHPHLESPELPPPLLLPVGGADLRLRQRRAARASTDPRGDRSLNQHLHAPGRGRLIERGSSCWGLATSATSRLILPLPPPPLPSRASRRTSSYPSLPPPPLPLPPLNPLSPPSTPCACPGRQNRGFVAAPPVLPPPHLPPSTPSPSLSSPPSPGRPQASAA